MNERLDSNHVGRAHNLTQVGSGASVEEGGGFKEGGGRGGAPLFLEGEIFFALSVR